MTINEISELEQSYTESKIQHICVAWFRLTFPHVGNLLFSVPNGGWRGGRAGATMVYEGQVKGVADLILLYPASGKSSLCIEMNAPGAISSESSDENGVKMEADIFSKSVNND